MIEGLPESDREPYLCTRDPATGKLRPSEFERSGMRAKLAVFDWDGDGKLDLLVGDVRSIVTPNPYLTAAQMKERDDLEKEANSAGANLAARGDVIRRNARHEVESHPPETGDFDLQELIDDRIAEDLAKDSDYRGIQDKVDEIATKLAPFKSGRGTHGFVWVYLRSTDGK